MQFWNELEGQTIAGRYPLRRLVRSEGRTAWFETQTDSDAAILGLTEALTDADEVAERLRVGQRLQHPNLVTIREVGRAGADKTNFVYAVMEHSDQNLADVLRSQALSKEEVRQLAEAMVGALTVIHHQGLVHGRVEPGSIVAVGETVKLRSDCLQTPGGSRAGDVAGLGATLFQAFTQSKTPSPEDPQINRIPAPFAEIVRNALNGRWTLAQVAMALKPPASAIPQAAVTPAAAKATAAPPPAAAPPATAPVRATAPLAAPSVGPAAGISAGAPTAAPVRKQEERIRVEPSTPPRTPPPAAPPEADGEEMPRRIARVAILGGVALIILVGLLWLLLRPKTQSTPPPAAAPVTAPPRPAASRAKPKPSAIPPASSKTSRTSKTAIAAQAAVAGTPTSVWRVVVYTFNKEDPAQRSVDEIRKKYSDLQAEVFTPRGDHPRYLVVIGGAMDRGQAMKLRDKARNMGFPADAYAQNFQE